MIELCCEYLSVWRIECVFIMPNIQSASIPKYDELGKCLLHIILDTGITNTKVISVCYVNSRMHVKRAIYSLGMALTT